MGRPDRPALSALPLLGAVAASTSTVALGPLVSRVGLLPDAVLTRSLLSLDTIAGGRLIAGLGTGDHLSRQENLAFGIPFESADRRRARLVTVGTALAGAGVPVWVGGGHQRTIDAARSLGAPVNLWGATPSRVAELSASGVAVTWGGPVGAGTREVAAQLVALAEAGATWAVCAWPESLEAVAEAARTVPPVSGAARGGQ
jgi:alkanesulfonate monooxygenase SsuD/methylene tetrahydromethanopterin reductase-like flavin-dependent oxidoreductase (luciferase family)